MRLAAWTFRLVSRVNQHQETQIEHFWNLSIFQPKTKFRKISSEFSFSNLFLLRFGFVWQWFRLLLTMSRKIHQFYFCKTRLFLIFDFLQFLWWLWFFLWRFVFEKIPIVLLFRILLFRISSLVDEGSTRWRAEKMAEF